jgi:hypothetical protein
MPAYSVGMLAPVPFLYAAATLKTRTLWLITAAYAPAWLAAWILACNSPRDGALATTAGFMFIALAIVGTAHAFAMRESLSRPADPEHTTPRQQSDGAVPAVTDPTDPAAAQLRAALAVLRSRAATHAASFPPACKRLLDDTLVQLDQIVSYVSAGGHADASLRSVQRMLTDYLPTSLDAYLRLPPDYARSHRNPDGRTAAEELDLQLGLLHGAAVESADAIYRDDALRLQVQSIFLQDKFGKSELDLT